jgi:hypothetical protein
MVLYNLIPKLVIFSEKEGEKRTKSYKSIIISYKYVTET